MEKLKRRNYEITIFDECYPYKIVVCTLLDQNCSKTVKEIDSLGLQNNPIIRVYEYDISTDYEFCEKYDIANVPHILVYKKDEVINSFVYKNLEDFKNRVTTSIKKTK